MLPMPRSLSLCMIVKNEERNLPRCLDSVRDLVGEIVIVDTGSTDRTPGIAAEYGAKVVPFDFTRVDFAAARNCSIAHATGRWILVLDADETMDRASAPMMEEIIERDWGIKLLELLKNIKRFAKNRNYIKPLDFGVHQFSGLL